MNKVKRLYKNFKPINYDLTIDVSGPNEFFQGKVIIDGELTGTDKKIILHAKQLEIISVGVNSQECDFEIDSGNDELIISSKKEFDSKVRIEISYKSKLTDLMHGIYPAEYEIDGIKNSIISTQFESHHAREAFPCIDEPEAKTTFDLTIIANNGLEVLANTPVKNRSKSSRVQTVEFESTPIMSTYLLAFVVGDIKSLSKSTKSGIEVKTWATKDKVQFTQFALDVAVDCLDLFENYFKIKYPLDKCDFIAIPNFNSGAMENWGCITFREAAMLVDPDNTNLHSKQFVAEVVAHELAHQWFGNLVTMEWWTDLWLNEGFATWIAAFAIDKLFPDWKIWSQFIVEDFNRAMSLDSIENTHPIEVEINNPDEIRNIFDGITYSKGAVVIRMLHDYLGEKDFQKGLIKYLKKYSYNNASTKDLWKSLEEQSDKPVSKFMNAWTSNAGFPLVKLDSNDKEITLTQQRYTTLGIEDSTLWPININFTNDEQTLLLEKEVGKIKLPENPSKINKNQSSFYLTSYEDNYFEEYILKNLNDLDEVDRLGILNDLFELAKSGQVSATKGLDIVSSLKNEKSPIVWDVVTAQLSSVRRVMDDDSIIENLRIFISKIIKDLKKEVTWVKPETEDYFELLLRPLIIGLAAFSNDKSTLAQISETFDKAQKPEDIDPDLRGIVYTNVVRTRDDQDTFDKLHDFYIKTSSPQEKQLLSSSLTNFKNQEIIKQHLAMIKTEVKTQDVSYWIAYSFMNRHAKNQAWVWLKENWQWLKDNFEGDISTFGYAPVYAAKSMNTKKQLDEFDDFFSTNTTPGIKSKVKQARELIQIQIHWRKTDLKNIKNYFK